MHSSVNRKLFMSIWTKQGFVLNSLKIWHLWQCKLYSSIRWGNPELCVYNFIIGKTFIKTELIFGGLYRKNNHFKIAVYYRILGYLLFRTLKFHVSLCFFFFFPHLQVLLLFLQNLLFHPNQHMCQKYIMVGKSFMMFFFRRVNQ